MVILFMFTLYWSYVFVETFAYEFVFDVFGVFVIYVFFVVVCVVGVIYVKYVVFEMVNCVFEDMVVLVIFYNDVRVATASFRSFRRKEVKRVVIF